MKVEIAWKKIDGVDCGMCSETCTFFALRKNRLGEEWNDCSLGMGVSVAVTEGQKPHANCPGPGLYELTKLPTKRSCRTCELEGCGHVKHCGKGRAFWMKKKSG